MEGVTTTQTEQTSRRSNLSAGFSRLRSPFQIQGAEGEGRTEQMEAEVGGGGPKCQRLALTKAKIQAWQRSLGLPPCWRKTIPWAVTSWGFRLGGCAEAAAVSAHQAGVPGFAAPAVGVLAGKQQEECFQLPKASWCNRRRMPGTAKTLQSRGGDRPPLGPDIISWLPPPRPPPPLSLGRVAWWAAPSAPTPPGCCSERPRSER